MKNLFIFILILILIASETINGQSDSLQNEINILKQQLELKELQQELKALEEPKQTTKPVAKERLVYFTIKPAYTAISSFDAYGETAGGNSFTIIGGFEIDSKPVRISLVGGYGFGFKAFYLKPMLGIKTARFGRNNGSLDLTIGGLFFPDLNVSAATTGLSCWWRLPNTPLFIGGDIQIIITDLIINEVFSIEHNIGLTIKL